MTLLARALGTSASESIAHLLDFYTRHSSETPPRTSTLTPVYAIYDHTRIDGYFDRATGSLAIPAGPGAGQYMSPSGAARAVITALRPQVSPIRTGWHFWRLAESGAQLKTLRGTPAHTRATPRPAAVTPPARTAEATPRTR